LFMVHAVAEGTTMLGLFASKTRKEDNAVAQMLLVTLASLKKTHQKMGCDFMLGTIRSYPGITLMTDVPNHMMFRYPNELNPFVFAYMKTSASEGISAVGGPPYNGFSVTVGLQGTGFLVSKGDRRGQMTSRGKYLGNWFEAQGASIIP
jgi:hypothetical protein